MAQLADGTDQEDGRSQNDGYAWGMCRFPHIPNCCTRCVNQEVGDDQLFRKEDRQGMTGMSKTNVDS